MIAALDVHYRDPAATAACVLFAAWTDAAPAAEHVARIAQVAPYEPGEFRKRELPCLLEVLRACAAPPEIVVIDGYAWLAKAPPDGASARRNAERERKDRPGLGAHLHEAIGGKVPVIGVAKTAFEGATAVEVLRGTSAKPLFVTAAGMDAALAAAHIASMHGPHRLPTLLQRADRLSRGI